MAATPLSPDIRILACPGSESLQLTLWLAHPGVEEVEFAKRPRTDPRVAVDRVISRKYKAGMGVRLSRSGRTRANRL
jgi:hypothetical protein